MHFPTDRTAHTTPFDGPVVDHWLEQKISQTSNASTMQDRSAMQEDPNLHSSVLYLFSYFSPLSGLRWLLVGWSAHMPPLYHCQGDGVFPPIVHVSFPHMCHHRNSVGLTIVLRQWFVFAFHYLLLSG